MATRYFKKSNLNNPLTLKNGLRLVYSHVVDNEGLVEASEPDLIDQLSRTIGKMGIIELTQAQADEFKKKQPSQPSAQKSALKIFHPNTDPFQTKLEVKQVGAARVLTGPLESVPPATVPANADPVAASSPAAPVVVSGKSKFSPRKGSAKKIQPAQS